MNLNTEASRISGIIAAIIVAAIPLAATYLGWTNAEADMWETLLLALVPAAIVVGGAEFTRRKVWSQDSHDKAVDEALKTEPPA